MGFFGSLSCAIGIHSWSEWNYKNENSCKLARSCLRCSQEEIGEEKHVWNGWVYSLIDSCKQERICQRCKKKETGEEKHIWGNYNYRTQKSCEIERSCERCKTHETGGVKHIWSEWNYEIADQATQEKTNNRILKKLDELRDGHIAYSEKLSVFRKDIVVESSPEIKYELKERIKEIEKEQEQLDKKISNWEQRLSERKDDKSSCLQSRTCSHCSIAERRINHLWGAPEYESHISCRLVQYCQRCGEKQFINEEERHQWVTWNYESPTSCRQVSYCQRCYAKSIKPTIEHKWGQWEADREHLDSCQIARYCRHCNAKEKGSEIIHQWSEWVYSSEEDCDQTRQCKRCGTKEKGKEEKHSWSAWEDWKDRKEYNLFDVKRICSRCYMISYGNIRNGRIVVSELNSMCQNIDNFIKNNFNNVEYINKHKNSIVDSINKLVDLNNNLYPSIPIKYIASIEYIVNLIKDSPDENIRVCAINGLLKLRRIQSSESEEMIKMIFQISSEQDASIKVREAAKFALQTINNN